MRGSDEVDITKNEVQAARSDLAELILDHMDRHRITSLQEFADRYKIGRSTIYELVRGRTMARGAWVRPRLETLIALSSALGAPLHELVYLVEPEAPGAAEMRMQMNAAPVRMLPVEIAGWVGAGPEQSMRSFEPPVYVDLNFARGRSLRAFRVRGDSMAAGKRPIMDGDLVIVDTNDKGYNTASVVARLKDGSYVCKALKDDKHGKLLQSRNVDHTNGTPSAVPLGEVDEIIGRVVRTIRDEGSRL